MQYLMQINHMLLVYLLVLLTLLLAILILLWVKLRTQYKQTRELSVKLDKMIDQVLGVGMKSDYKVRTKKF